MEIPIVVSEDEINIAGFVNALDLSVDVGPPGNRGSLIFAGAATPTTSPITTPVDAAYGTVNYFQTGDLYIKLGQPNHGYLYIYVQEPGGEVWTPLFPVQRSIYYGTHAATFTDGVSAAVSVPLEDIIGSEAAPTYDKFKVLVTADENDTNAYVVSVKTVTVNGTNLDIVFNARTISNVPAVALSSGSIDLNLSIGVIE